MNDLRQLLDKYEEMLAAALHAADEEKRVLCLNYIGTVHRLMGNWNEARSCQRNAVSLARNLTNQLPLCAALSNLGALQAERGEYGEALDLLDESLNLAKRIGNPLRMASAHGTIGKVYMAKGAWGKARVHFEAALSHGVAEGSLRHQMCSNTSLGLLSAAVGDFGEANRFLDHATTFSLSIEEEIGQLKISGTLSDGSIDFEETLKRRRDVFVLKLARATLARCMRRHDVALAETDSALEIAQKINYSFGYVSALIEKSWLLLRSDVAAGLQTALEAVDRSRKLGARQLEAAAFHVKGALMSTGDDPVGAVDCLRLSLQEFSALADEHNTGRVQVELGLVLLKRSVESEGMNYLLNGMHRLISLGKVAESYDTVSSVADAISSAASYVEDCTIRNNERLLAIQEAIHSASSEAQVENAGVSGANLERHLASLYAVGRVVLQCAKLLMRLVPSGRREIADTEQYANRLVTALGVLSDQQTILRSDLDIARQAKDRFEHVRAERTNLFLQGIQSALAGIGSGEIYTALLGAAQPPLVPLDAVFVVLTVAAWCCFPIMIIQLRLRIGSAVRRVILSAVVVAAIALSTGYLWWRLAPRSIGGDLNL